MTLVVREHIIYNSGPHRTLPGVWWLRLTDKEFLLLTPFFAVAFYNWALDSNSWSFKRGWSISWGRAPLVEGEKLFMHTRERLDYRWSSL
jgi:hypothetical protein